MGNPSVDVPGVDAFRAAARDWLRANLPLCDPAAAAAFGVRGYGHTTDEDVVTARALQRRLYDGGFAGISMPTEYGGLGLTPEHERAFNEEAAAYQLPDFGIVGGTTFRVCVPTMLAYASPQFLAHHIPRMLRGEELWAQFFSEPEAGSDLAGVRTRAVLREDGGWTLNGAKIWSSGAQHADYGMCLARTNDEVPKHQGLTWFAVKTDLPGVTVAPITQINGDAEFCQEFFDDVQVSDDDRIGEVDQGWAVARTMLVFERGFAATLPNAAAKRELAPDLVALATRLGREKDPTVRQLIARASINDYAQDRLRARIGARMSAGLNAGIAAYGKLAGGIMQPVRVQIEMQIGGPQALVWLPGDSTAQMSSLNYLNGRLKSIAGGTSQMQRNGVAEAVLGLPREPSFDAGKPFREVIRDAQNWTGKIT